ncbi:MAG: hypothetical protein ACYTG1_02890 [Planctomycetota bacterium]
MTGVAARHEPTPATPLGAVLAVTFLASLGTGVFWFGISFIAKHGYGFDQTRNLWLYVVMGAGYTIGAFQAGRFSRWAARWLAPRSQLAAIMTLQAALCVGPVVVAAEWMLWVAANGVMITSSLLWPLVESYLTAGRHGPAMRSAIGWFNLIWMTAVFLPLIAMAPILEDHAQWAVGGLALANVAALAPIARFGVRPGAHDEGLAGRHVADEYPLLLRSARVLLPVSYMLASAMAPILPYRFEVLEVDVAWETPATATWLAVRVVVVVLMMRMAFWHGRWGALLAGAVAMTAGFGLVVLAPSMPLVLAGFTAFGAGLGVVYFTALYYAMSVGRAGVDAGGTHEGLIGAGYTAGPLAALAGTALGGGARIVGVVWAVMIVSAVPAVRPYLAARARRRTGYHQADP